MATKWKKTYTDISNVNGGNEYETGDHITKETVNVALNNTAYLQQTKVTAEVSRYLFENRYVSNEDANNYKRAGMFYFTTGNKNLPDDLSWIRVLVISDNATNSGCIQIAFNIDKSFTKMWCRRCLSGAWHPWKQIDNDPSLYNLGAYDTYVDNDDGTTTITRQTGYWNSNNATVNEAESYHYTNGMRLRYDKVSNIDSGEGEGKAKSNWSYRFDMISKPNNVNYDCTAIWLRNPFIFVNGKNDFASALAYINKKPVSIEYKLATSYTETIITGLPQITLDKQGCEWLRSEWEKGLNLLEIEDVGSTTLNGITYSINNGVVTLNGTPTANLDIVLGTINLEQGNYTYRSFATLINGSLMTLATDINGNRDLLQQSNDIDYVSQVLTNDIYTFKLRIATSCPTLTNVTVKPMLVRGSVPYNYQPYNSAYHITNNQADLLSDEEEKSRNLLIENFYKYNDNYRMNLGYCELKANTTYCLSTSSIITSRILIVVGSKENVLTTYSFTNKLAFTPTQGYKGNLVLQGTFTDIALPTWAILNKGSEPLPYVAYNGSIVHEKQLSLLAPSMGHKTANECMMNVTGSEQNTSSSDKYILLGNIIRSPLESDKGFIIKGTIGGFTFENQAQINVVAYWRNGFKWKGSYTQNNLNGNFNNAIDLIITSTYKIYLVLKAGAFYQYNLQLQGMTIQYTGNILTAKEGSTASTFSQSEAIDLTALDTGLSDKLKFIDNNVITDPDGTGDYKIDNSYIYDEELATNGVDYAPFNEGVSYNNQSDVNQDFYKQIKSNANRHLYHTTIIHAYNTTLYGQNIGEILEVTIFTSDDKTGYNTPGTAWTILRDYLNNNGYTLGNVANWITSNQVYPCNGQLLKYSSSGSVSLTYNIYGVSYNNGKFYVHYYTNTNAYGTSELSYPDSYWKVKSTKIF